ncbi:formate dehydrogenase accessory sulfurtransferase FdhD [Helicobacter sp. MIT 14-3879]|nr:formate dehydrogenase accessory sulfurtransferase FdhD [Helicobacter sp. MIT 14-3879]
MLNKFTIQVPIAKINNDDIIIKNDIIIKEERVSFYLNGNKIISTMCLPNEQDFHIVGFLMNEGVLESIDDINSIKISKDGLSVYLNAKINEDNISNLYYEKTLTSGCCVGVSANFEGKIVEKFISSKISFSIDKIKSIIEEFDYNSKLFNLTGCVHKVAIICDNKKFISEDIGRHNAVDKAIGKARLKKANLNNAILIVSGRLSMEMVIKCAMSDIPVVISRAATTALGVKSAQKLGITLIGFARNGNFNIYTHKSRILT